MWLTGLWQLDHLAPVQWGAVICASLAGAWHDVRRRRIPNYLSAAVLVSGFVFAFSAAGPGGLADAVAACIMLAAPYVLLFIFAGGGAGDAKLMGALGAWLGMLNAMAVLVCVAVAGILLALLMASYQRRLQRVLVAVGLTLAGLAMKFAGGRTVRQLAVFRPQEVDDSQKMPYGPAIFVGVCLAALGVAIWNG